MDQVTIIVPASTANVGLGYDVWALGLKRPQLRLTYIRKRHPGVEVAARSASPALADRILGYAGKLALESFLREHGIGEGAYLYYEDEGYPMGGLGRSGAEAVGAIIAAAVVYDKRLSREEVVLFSAKGEPGEHKDNVAASTNGRFNIIATSPLTGRVTIDCYDAPEDLGVAIGFSSHKKRGGTAEARRVLESPARAEDLIVQMGLVSAMTAAFVTGNTDRVLEVAWGDRFHERRRADSGAYGAFTYREFQELKRKLFAEFHVALLVSGAGPNMTVLYNKRRYPHGVVAAIAPVMSQWFQERGIDLELREAEIATEGAYDYAQRQYAWQRLL
ncbi:MAG: hypothetical protein NZ930_04370 [Candidatus Bipolaricaulota bacterium]|nr:hypothetical protein [Candidatus Bipolaricaulota bacterium]MDW8030545.1 hypothetical protein [Candidatus Bipolaricaulota bacterium]